MRVIGLVFLTSLLMMRLVFGQTPAASETGLKGVITVSPAHPGPTREDISSSAPVANCAFTAKSENGAPISFTSAPSEGRFQIALPPGHYTVSIKEHRARRCGAFEVDVVSGKMTAVEWRCDSGMR